MKHEILQIDSLIFNKVRGYKLVGNKIIGDFYNITDEVKKQVLEDMKKYEVLIYRCTIVNDEIVNIELSKFIKK